jgi:ketosteroid isomerase-like protein
MARCLRTSNLACLCFVLGASSLEAQGLADVAVPKSGASPVAVYRAKVRESVTAALQLWAKSLEHRDSAAIAATYTANARSVIGDAPEAITAGAIVSQLYKTPLAGAFVDVTVKDFDMSGDLAFVSTILIVPSRPGDSTPAFHQSLFVFRFDDWHNRWQVREQFIDWHGPTEAAAPGL